MVEPTQFSFELKEVTAALLEKEGIRSGKWSLAFEFSVSTGSVGKSAKPAATTVISRVQLVSMPEESVGNPSTVDAATLAALGGITALD